MLRLWSLGHMTDPQTLVKKESLNDPKHIEPWISWATLKFSASSP